MPFIQDIEISEDEEQMAIDMGLEDYVYDNEEDN